MTEPQETAIEKWHGDAPLGRAINIGYALTSPAATGALNSAWPGDLNPDRRDHRTKQLIKQAILSIDGSQAKDVICRCVGVSVLDSLVACASMDLSLNKAFGEAYLVPFAGICTLMVGYRGFVKLLVNTGFVTHCESVLVYEGEVFEVSRDETGPHWKHVPDVTLQGNAANVKACYAAAYTRAGGTIFEAMNLGELEKVRKASKAVQSGKKTPYDYWTTEMYRKAPLRRLQKWIPKVADNLGYELLAKACEHDNGMFDLERSAKYVEAIQQHKLESREKKQIEWSRRMSDEPQADPPAEPQPDPADESTWPQSDDGEPIPPDFW